MATITKRGGTYRIKVSCGYSADGRQITRSTTWKPDPGMTKRQEEKELNHQAVLFEERVKTGQFIGSNIKFADFVETWFKDYAEKQLRPKTLLGYKKMAVRTNAAIGHIRLDRLQPQHILEFYNQLAENGVREDTKYCCKGDLRGLLKDNGLKMKEFSERSGVSERTLRAAVNGNNVAEQTANKICNALKMRRSELFRAAGDTNVLSNNTIQHYHRFISSVLSTAVQWQIISSNPCSRVKAPKIQRKEAQYLDEEQSLELLKALENEPIMYKTLIMLILYTGMRRGEACGLEWSDIDFENNLVDINKTSTYIPHEGVFDDETKNYSSSRPIKIPESMTAQLREYRKIQAEQRLKLGDKWEGSPKIFTTWKGSAICPDTVTSWFHSFIKRHDLPPVTVHGLRHTNATLLIYNGTNIKTVSDRLGHADVSTTGNIYAHAIKTADEMAAEALEDIFSKKKTAGAG